MDDLTRRRTLMGGVAAWAAVSLLQALVLTAQEGLPFTFAILGTGLNYGLLALLAIPVWHFCRWQGEQSRPLWLLGAPLGPIEKGLT